MYKIVAFVAVVLAGVFVAPVAASAVPYTPGAEIVASPINLTPGESTSITAGSGYFGSSQSVHVAVSGTAASDWGVPGALRSTSAGAVALDLTAPSSSTGHYTVTLTSSSASGSVVLTVTPNKGNGGGGTGHGSSSNPGGIIANTGNSSGTTTADGTLAETGTSPIIGATGSGLTRGASYNGVDVEMIIIWALIALLALLLAFIIVSRVRRKEQTPA